MGQTLKVSVYAGWWWSTAIQLNRRITGVNVKPYSVWNWDHLFTFWTYFMTYPDELLIFFLFALEDFFLSPFTFYMWLV